MRLVSRLRGVQSVLDDLEQAGALRVLFPRAPDLQAVLLNTSGGTTGGDRLDVDIAAGAGSQVTVTTQAAERAYRANGGTGRITTRLTVQAGATLHWLPQEMILFDGCNLSRRLRVDLAAGARLLMVEPVVFGRRASGERLANATFHDDIEILREEAPLYRDRTRLAGDIEQSLSRAAIGQGATAMASIVHICPSAEAQLGWLRSQLPATGGASLLAPDCLVLRLLAEDSFSLRKTLLPILDRLSQNTLPKCWRL